MSASVRQPTMLVSIGGINPAGQYQPISATCSYGYDQRTATATIRVKGIDPASGIVLQPYLTRIVLNMNATPPARTQRFVGVLVEVDRALYPLSVDLICKGPLVRAERFTCDTTGGLDLSHGGLGDTDENMVRNLLQEVGLTTSDYSGTNPPPDTSGYWPVQIGDSDGTHAHAWAGSGTGKTLGTVAPTSFVWAEGETAISMIEKIDEISCTANGAAGYRTYEQYAGAIIRGVVNPYADTTARYSFTEGQDLFQIGGAETVQDIQNRVAVVGYNPGTSGSVPYAASVQQANPYLRSPDGKTYLYATKQINNPMIERSLTTDAGNGVAAQDVALWNLSQLNRKLHRYTFTTHRDDQILPSNTIAVVSPSTGLSDNYYVQNVTNAIDEHGAYTQTIIALAGPGSTAPVALTPGVDFTLSLEEESIVLSGAETTLYTVHCIPVITANSPIGTYAWSTSGGANVAPASGSGDTFTTTTTSLTNFIITLSVTDSNGLTAAGQRTVPPNNGTNWLIRKLYLAGTDCIEEWTPLAAWKSVAESGATVTTNAPIWGAGTSALPSGNDLGSAPTASTPFAGGETVTALWVETNVSTSAVLAGGSAGHVAYSSGGGSSWNAPLAGPDSHPVLKCLMSGSVAGQWFVLTQAGLYRSDNSGAGWVTVVAAASGETFVDWCLSFQRGMIAMSGGRLLCDLAGTAQTFPGTPPSSIQAVAADIRSDQFYCYDSAGNTYKTTSAGGTAMSAMAALPAGLVVQPRGLWRDGSTRGLLYIAGGSGGCWKSLDGFGSSAGYKQIRKPGTGSSPAGAVYTQIGSDGLLNVAPSVAASGGAITPITVVSDTTVRAVSLWPASGTTNVAPPPDSAGRPWYDPQYVETATSAGRAWGYAAIAHTEAMGLQPVPGAHVIWTGATGLGPLEQALFRATFTLPAGSLSSVVLKICSDNKGIGAWINGIALGPFQAQGLWTISSGTCPYQTITIPPSRLIAGGTNVLAVWAQDNSDDSDGEITFLLTVQ